MITNEKYAELVGQAEKIMQSIYPTIFDGGLQGAIFQELVNDYREKQAAENMTKSLNI